MDANIVMLRFKIKSFLLSTFLFYNKIKVSKS